MEKFTPEALNIEGIRQWDWIKKNFSSTSILLGNGFSINFSDTLRYKFLYEFFISSCSDTSKELFDVFSTKNFESVLGNIEIAKTVCQTLKIETDEFAKFHTEVREGLINSINKIHPKPIDVNQDKLKWIGLQFKNYNQIFTTNYDLFLYYIILEARKFGDHLFNSASTKYNYFGEPDKMNNHHIYYLHGALFLFENGLTTLKIKRPSEGWLLNAITDEIANNNYPLFISEGHSDNKLKAIQSNSYLSFCLRQLENNSDKTLVIFGQSLSKQDAHIVKIIDKHYEKVAISIRVDDYETMGELKAEKNRISGQFKKTELDFFDAKTLFDFEPKFLIQ
jgi:hypothetical protein